jgi:hypothetical protein
MLTEHYFLAAEKENALVDLLDQNDVTFCMRHAEFNYPSVILELEETLWKDTYNG